MLTEIRLVRRGSRQRLIVLDGEPWRLASADSVRDAGLQVGDDSSPQEFSERLSSVEPRLARDRAIRLLTYRDRSSVELQDRLEEDGFPEQVAAATAERMCDLGLVDDDRFARALARTLARKGWGRSRATREMIARGVDPVLADEALSEALPADEEILSALAQARTFCGRAGATRERVASRLMRKGFGPRISLDAARKAFEEQPDASDHDAREADEYPDGELS